MSYETRAVDLFLGKKDNFVRNEGQEVEISFLLQNARPDDPRILTLLVDRYGSEIQRLVQALLNLPPGERVAQAAAQILANAGRDIQDFWGQASPRKWLFGLAIHFARYHPNPGLRFPQFKPSAQAIPDGAQAKPAPRDPAGASIWKEVDRLPEPQRLVIVLRYLFGLGLQEIADLLDDKLDEVDFHLYSARSRLVGVLPPGKRLYFNLHPERLRQIDDYRNDQLDHEAAVHIGLVQHVAGCEHCFAYTEDLADCEEAIFHALQHRWPSAPMEPGEAARLEESARFIKDQPKPGQFLAVPLRQVLWSGGILLVGAILAWSLFRAGLEEGMPASNAEAASAPGSQEEAPVRLPDPVGITAVNLSEPGEESFSGTSPYIYHFEPGLSADGSLISFSSNANILQDNPYGERMGVYIYNRDAGSFERGTPVSEGAGGLLQLSSSISGNGRWVAYSSSELVPDGRGLPSREKLGVFLYDRQRDQAERIDSGFDGSPPDGESFAPVISADGRWVVFWSTSSNLVSGELPTCLPPHRDFSCADAFIRDRETGTTFRIPVGRELAGTYMFDRLDVSADGRWIPITLDSSDRIASEIELTNQAGAYLFDRKDGVFSRVDLASDGSPGDNNGFAVSISADGKYAAFISQASNLVPGEDTPGADVFLRDLDNGVTERVTGRGDGVMGFELLRYNPGSGGFWGNLLNLSADGRYLTFLGRRESLPGEEPENCFALGETPHCNAIFVFDRESGRNDQITSASANGLYLFPNISGDGRWVSYVQVMTTCEPLEGRPACTEIWVYDRENEWTYPVTKGKFALPEVNQFPVATLMGGRRPMSVAFSPDLGFIATTTANDTVTLWNGNSGSRVGEIESSSEAEVTSLAFSPDGELLAAGLADGRVDLWRFRERFNKYTLDGHPGEIRQVAFFKDGRLAVRTAEAIWLWERKGEVFVRTHLWEFPPGDLSSMALAPAVDLIATSESDNLVWVRRASSGEVLLRLEGHGSGLNKAVFSTDGRFLAAVWRGGLVDVWKIETEEEGAVEAVYLRTLAHSREVSHLGFAPAGVYLVTVSETAEFRMWNVFSGTSTRLDFPSIDLNNVTSFSLDPLAAGVYDGAGQGKVHLVYLWSGFSSQDGPSFFELGETDGDLPEGSLPAYRTREPGQGYTYVGKEVIYNNLYQADKAVPYPLLAPTYLPPDFKFRLAQVFPTGAVSLHYDLLESPGEKPVATLVILQHPDKPGFPGYTVGASALIQDVEITGLPAEYVRGEWQSFTLGEDDQGQFAWHWDSQSASQRLRWKDGEQLYAIHYRPLRSGGIEEKYIQKPDLLDIAGNLAPLGQPTSPEYLLTASITRDEQGCLVSALRSGRPVGSRAMAGWNQSGDCQLVFADRSIQGQRIAFAETDLDCDGGPERMEIRVLPGVPESPPTFQVVLMETDFTGRYRRVWSMEVPDSGQDLSAIVEIIRSEGCGRFLSLEVSNGSDSSIQLFSWDGKEMHPAGEAAGEGLFDYGHDALPPM
jgi:WD40 repeat protein/DNA-directed RNA polymerase specialized sigma24 family protein